MTLYVSNLSPETTREDVLKAFQPYGKGVTVALPGERMSGGVSSGVHRGYAFVVLKSLAEGKAAMTATQGKPLCGSAMSVKVANPKWTHTYQS